MSQGGKTLQSRALPEPVCLCPWHPGARVQHGAHPLQKTELKFPFTKPKGAGPYNPRSRPKAARRRSSVPAVRGGRGGPGAHGPAVTMGLCGSGPRRGDTDGRDSRRTQKAGDSRGEQRAAPRARAPPRARARARARAGPNEGSTAQGWPRPRPPPPATLRGTRRFFRQKRTISDG